MGILSTILQHFTLQSVCLIEHKNDFTRNEIQVDLSSSNRLFYGGQCVLLEAIKNSPNNFVDIKLFN